MASDPFRAQFRSERQQRRLPLREVTNRLAALGATDDELEALAADWDNPDWDEADKRAFFSQGDARLLAAITALREEHRLGTETTEAEAAREREAYLAQVDAEAWTRAGGTVAEVLAWVDGDHDRAAAAARHERSSEGAHRTTLLAQLEGVLARED